MNGNKPSTVLDPEDDAPDLSTPEWQAEFAKVEFRRGRPKQADPKVSTTIRLDRDILDFFRSGGSGWQTRLNEVLRAAISGPKTGAGGKTRPRSLGGVSAGKATPKKTA